MENSVFRAHLIRKLIISGAFVALAVGSGVAISLTNTNVIKPNEGFITTELCKVENKAAANNLGDKLAEEIEQEGIVLAKNDGILPLSKSIKNVNVFGYDVMEWVISNSGSGSADAGKGQKAYSILDALTEKGISYNTDLTKYYKKWATARDRGVKSYSSSYDTIYRLTNPSLTNNADFAKIYNSVKNKSNTAIVCIGRYGGEHLDPPHEQVNNYKAKPSTKDATRGYLEITKEEEELLTAVGKDYKNVIVVINSTNVMQMDFMSTIPGLKACLLVGPTGTMGAKAIPDVIWGDVNPSGRTADTWPMNHRYNVTYYTSGFWSDKGNSSNAAVGNYYTGVPSGANLANSNNNAGHGHAVFADYYEGIYVGYRWFETADKEGFWDQLGDDGKPLYGGYDKVVAYPFGYGKGYSEFEWELEEITPNAPANINPNEDIVAKVKVTNKGNYAGKDVVEIYLTAQYYPGEIEKSYVKLVGFAKTPIINPGKSETVEITLHTREFMSFDCYDSNKNSHAGYELDRGSYEIKFMTNAHTLKAGMENNVVK